MHNGQPIHIQLHLIEIDELVIPQQVKVLHIMQQYEHYQQIQLELGIHLLDGLQLQVDEHKY
jgi:hypothetical protein